MGLLLAGCHPRALEAAPPAEAWRPPRPEAPPPAPAPGPSALDRRVETLLDQMTLEQKLGQLLMVGFDGLEVDEAVAELVRGRHVGGVCLFKRNIESADQVARLNDGLRALLEGEVPPFIAVDQEGGNVVRISDRVMVLPGNMALAATRSPELAYQAGRAQGEDLRRLGFNMNLAPVLDVNTNARNPVIGIRSFGDEPALVAQLGAAFIRGQSEARLVTVAKHFPGHGSTDADSHHALPVSHADREELLSQLRPFEEAIAVGLDGLMTAHVAMPTLTGTELPATVSPAVLGDLLRERLAFEGLVLTDELEMEAIDRRFGVGRAAVLAVLAGADMVLVPWRRSAQAEVQRALAEAVASGEISPERLDASVRRILAVKLRRGLFEPLPPREERLAALGSRRDVAEAIARQSVTLLRAEAGAFPLRGKRRIAVITAEAALGREIQARAPTARVLVVPAYPDQRLRARLRQKAQALARRSEVVVVGLINSRQLELVTMAAATGRPVIAVSMGLPYLAEQVPEAKAVLTLYSYRESSAAAAAAAIFGEQGTPGRLPVSLSRFRFGHGLDPVGGTLAENPAPAGDGPRSGLP